MFVYQILNIYIFENASTNKIHYLQLHNDKDENKEGSDVEYVPVAPLKPPTYALIAARDKHRASSPSISFKSNK